MQLIKKLIYILPWFLILNIYPNNIRKNTMLICYGKLNAEHIKGYKYVILEPRYYLINEIEKIRSQNGKVFAYISLGEVNKDAPHYDDLKDLTLGKNSIWNSYYLNLKSEKTVSTLLNIVDEIFRDGFDGLFLDNIDNYTIYGPQKEQQKELINLLKMIKGKYFGKDLIQNSGLEIISSTCPYINTITIESVATHYTFENKRYKLRNSNEFTANIKQINIIGKAYDIPIILIEYADSKKLYNEILKRISPTKLEYFIGNIDLQNIPKFNK